MKKDIYQTHQDLLKKKVSVFELTKECLKNAKESNSGAFISLLEDQSLEQAKIYDQNLNDESSYLYGIPYNLKDLFITKGIRTTAGSKILYNYVPSYEGFVSSRLQEAGGVLVGKASCDEFGMGSTNEFNAFGSVDNPLERSRVPGGSSGATAASIAEGSSFYGIGTDTGGSSRQPANFCGIVGFKPTYGTVSRYGQIAYASSLDQASPMGKSSLDIACIMQHLTGKDPRDATNTNRDRIKIVEELIALDSKYFKGKKIGFSESFLESLEPKVQKGILDAKVLLEKAGATFVELSFPYFKHSVAAYYIIATSEASSNLARFDGIHFGHRTKNSSNLEMTYKDSRTEGFGEEVIRRILLGTFSLSSGYCDAYYKKACQIRNLIRQDFDKAFNDRGCDFIFSPVCSSVAFKKNKGTHDPVKMYMNDLYTIPVNLAGLPGLALPYGKAEEGLPTGFQLLGNRFRDAEVLRAGHAFERLG